MDERIRLALQAASDKKAIDMVVLDLKGIASFTDFFVIASGANERQVHAIADGIVEALKKAGLNFRNQMETGPGGKQIQLEDPDGNPIELFEPAG